MRRMLRNLLALTAGVAVLLLVCEAVARLVMPPTFSQRKLAAMEASRGDVEVAVVGSSRAARGLDPSAMPWPTYNYADDGQSPNWSAQVALHQAQRLRHLKAVVVVMDEFAFGTDDPEDCAADYQAHGYAVRNPNRWRMRLSSLSLLFRHRGQLLPRVTPVYASDRPPDPQHTCLLAPSGLIWTPSGSADLSDEAAKREAEVRNTGYRRQLRPEVLALLREFVGTALAQHLRLAFVEPPVHARYRAYLDATMLADHREDVGRLMSGEPAAAVCHLSYFEDARFPDRDFGDPDHLNSLGAAHWAQILSRDLSDFIR